MEALEEDDPNFVGHPGVPKGFPTQSTLEEDALLDA